MVLLFINLTDVLCLSRIAHFFFFISSFGFQLIGGINTDEINDDEAEDRDKNDSMIMLVMTLGT